MAKCLLLLIVMLAAPAADAARPVWTDACGDAAQGARTAARQLAYAAHDLLLCAESGDFADDCAAEMERAEEAQRDYRSAVAAVHAACR
ncbi:MAG: hypothetical protein M3Z21_06510 [Pseudomonadota bacterium]|nr:hypothetical protein [Pseudomonadota bacterium]